MENLPNELYLIIFSYLTKCQLIQSFSRLNQRFNRLLRQYFSHVYLSSNLTRRDLNCFYEIQQWIRSLTIENQQIAREFLRQSHLNDLHRMKFIDFIEDCHSEILHLVFTAFQSIEIQSQSFQELHLDFYQSEHAKSWLNNERNLCQSIPVCLRLILPKLSEYFQIFQSSLLIDIRKLSISIFSIDEFDSSCEIHLPHLDDFQIEICFLPFHSLRTLLPKNSPRNSLKRFAFIGRTNNLHAKSWRSLLSQYQSIDRFDLHLSAIESINFFDIEQQWNEQFPGYIIDYHPEKKIFRFHSAKFDRLERMIINESIRNVEHLEYIDEIKHLIIRSEYWCSWFEFSSNILKNFHSIQHLTISYRQLEYLHRLEKNFLQQIIQLHVEFSEQYCRIDENLAKEFHRLKSLSLSSFYDGIHDLHLHSTIEQILLRKFPQIIYLFIDSIRIIDEEHIEHVITRWYTGHVYPPMIDYQPGKSFSIWF